MGLLSPGDMGHVVAAVLREHGVRVITCLDGRSARTRALARKAEVEQVASYAELVRQTELVLSILPPAAAEAAARDVAEAMRASGHHTIYADCNAVSPATVRRIGRIITAAAGRFVDASIIGPPPRRPGTTRFYASGPDAAALAALAQYGLDVRLVGEQIGQASGLKMAYAALTKGTAALALLLLTAADATGLYAPLVKEFEISQPQQYQWMQQILPGVPPKARRWVAEMEEIAATFQAIGLTPRIHQGAAEMYQFLGQTSLADETPESRDRDRSLKELIEVLSKRLAQRV